MTGSELTKIERQIVIRAPRSRVWRALTTAGEFSKWFSADFTGVFEPGKRIDMVSTHPAAKCKPFYVIVERVEPEHTFSWRWHPGSANPAEDGTTLVEFHLAEVPDGTLVKVTESGFDRISLVRRAKAFHENGNGWEQQLTQLSLHAQDQNGAKR